MDRSLFINQQLKRIDGSIAARKLAKHQKMCISPFVFFRGSSQLFYADLAAGNLATPDAFTHLPLTTVMGDCHTSNFGFFTEQGSHGDQIVFSINDFDDACLGHAYWDIMRYAVSLCLSVEHCQGVQQGRFASEKDYQHKAVVNQQDALLAIRAFIEAYTGVVDEVLQSDTNKQQVLKQRFSDFETPSALKKRFKKASSVALGGEHFLNKSSLAKAIDVTNLPPRFIDNQEKFTRKDVHEESLKKHFSPYFYDHILDAVGRVNSGTGSVNMGRYYLLLGPKRIETPDEIHHCHVVEVKQQRTAAPIAYFPNLHHQNQLNPAHLTVKCQRRMQSTIDYCLDEAFYANKHWLIRSRHHAKVGIDPEHIGLGKINAEQGGFVFYAKACGEELARAHCRSDRSSVAFELAIYDALKRSQDSLVDIALQYTEQTKQDWQWLCSSLS